MNQVVTDKFNSIINEVIENYQLIDNPTDKVKAGTEILKILIMSEQVNFASDKNKVVENESEPKEKPKKGRPKKAKEEPAEAESLRANLENAPQEEEIGTATIAETAKETNSVQQAGPITSSELDDTWTPRMQELYKKELASISAFIEKALNEKYIDVQWISDNLSKASGGMLCEYTGLANIPPKFFKVFYDMLLQAWAIKTSQMKQQ